MGVCVAGVGGMTRSHTQLSLLIQWGGGSCSEDFSSNILRGE